VEDEELAQLLRQGIAAARAGHKEQAKDLLLQVLDRNEEIEAAWLWLSGVVDDPEERHICLENVLALNPGNAAAQAGLRYLAAQGLNVPPGPTPSSVAADPHPPRSVLTPIPDEPARPDAQPTPPGSKANTPQLGSSPPFRPRPTVIQIDPFGCPYCGGPVSGEESRCDHCRRLVAVRSRKRAAGASLGWLSLSFVLLAVASWGEGYLAAQLVQIGRLPAWLTQTAVRFLVGSALFNPAGLAGDLVQFADTFVLINTLLAGLCIVAALGLALRFRAVYFGSFLLAGVLIAGTGAGLLTSLVGWVPAVFRVGLVALAVKWLADSAPAFEWETRSYNADVDHDLHNDLDYYNRGLGYRDLGMWAKAAAHWQVAAQLGPAKAQYRVAVANAYLKMGYPEAALAEADKALTRDSGNAELRAFRDSLASATMEESH
jgi:tetratricopeptide (TPR) repeat protein